jgi:hypothetical protein
MSTDRRIFDKYFCFESYGVTIRVESHRTDLLKTSETIIRKALVGEVKIIDNQETEHVIGISRSLDGSYVVRDGNDPDVFELGRGRKALARLLSIVVRFKVAEFAVDRVFVHAGVVGWKGKAIVLPANSYGGKTTLTAELVKNGATYYSDDFAVFDQHGSVHPFARPLSVRIGGDNGNVADIDAASLGGTIGIEPLSVGFVLLTEYRKGSRWRPKLLSQGEGMIEIISQTIPIRYAPEFSLRVLKKVTSQATIAKSYRNDAKDFAKRFLDFVDSN